MWYNNIINGGRILSVITMSRQPYSLGDEIAIELSQHLDYELVTREKLLIEFLPDVVFPHDLNMLRSSAKHYLKPFKGKSTFLDYIDKSLHEYAKNSLVVFVGFGSQMLFANDSDTLHFRIVAPREVRIKRVIEQYHVSEDEADNILTNADKKQRRFITTLFDKDVTDPLYYNMIINTGNISVEEAVLAILSVIEEREAGALDARESQTDAIVTESPADAELKNQAEVEFAKLLDMYHIEWKYEPKTFPIEWDAEGNVTSAFSPDFYLTNFDTYIELTTMNQKYVTHKNRKVKKLKKLYPNVNIKIVYKKDFHSLVERFNLSRGDK